MIKNNTHFDLVLDQLQHPAPVFNTGFTQLDSLTGGIGHGKVVIVGGRPSMGKSSFLIDITRNFLRQDVPVLFLSAEMSAGSLMFRMIVGESLISSRALKESNLNEVEKEKLQHTVNHFKRTKIWMEDETRLTPTKIMERVHKLREVIGDSPFVVMVDYLQLLQSDEPIYSRNLELESIITTLQAEFKSLPAVLFVASQLNRGLDSRENPYPRLSDLKDSGSIEQSADIVMLLFRPDYYKISDGEYHTKDTGTAQVIVAKNRDGSTGVIDLAFIPDITSFRNTFNNQIQVDELPF
jgi:replicative DNA helicase